MSDVRFHFGSQVDETTPLADEDATVIVHRFQFSIEAERDLLSVSQFADEARITPQAVRKMIAEERLRAKKVGEQHVISRAELNRYLSE